MTTALEQWTATDRAMRATPQWYHEPRATWPAHVDAGTLPEPVYAAWLSEMDRRRESMREQRE